jgi:RimJ/RimL family protein N-acetyltransferase
MEFETERLCIRSVCMDDKESMFRYRSIPEINQYLSVVPQSVDDIAGFIDKTSSDINIAGTWFQLVIVERASNVLIGDIGIHFINNNTENKQVEIGYTLDKEFQGKGFATEALTVTIDYLINSLHKHRIIASIDPANAKSIKLVERLGFRKEAHFIESIFFHGKWVDDLVYALLAKHWKNNAPNYSIKH